MFEVGGEPIEVVTEGTSTKEEERAVQAVFAEFDIKRTMRVQIRKDDIDLPWLVSIATPMAGRCWRLPPVT